MTLVKFTPNLKRFFPDLKPFETEKNTILDLVNELDNKYPGIKGYILDDQEKVRKHVQIFIGDEMMIDRSKVSKAFKEKEIYIMQALSGG